MPAQQTAPHAHAQQRQLYPQQQPELPPESQPPAVQLPALRQLPTAVTLVRPPEWLPLSARGLLLSAQHSELPLPLRPPPEEIPATDPR